MRRGQQGLLPSGGVVLAESASGATLFMVLDPFLLHIFYRKFYIFYSKFYIFYRKFYVFYRKFYIFYRKFYIFYRKFYISTGGDAARAAVHPCAQGATGASTHWGGGAG